LSITRHHIDKRAERLIADDAERLAAAEDHNDKLLTTADVADWLSVSHQFLEIGRLRGFGPRFTRVTKRMIRYRRKDVIAWLEERVHQSTAEYSPAAAGRKAAQEKVA
jgi:hypothetical protein